MRPEGAIPIGPNFPKISDQLWADLRSHAGSIIPDTDNKAKGRGRAKADPRDLLDIIVLKLRTGVRWDCDDLGKGGTTAFKFFKPLVASGIWDSLWRLILADQTLALSEPEQRAATEYQILKNLLKGKPTDWHPAEPERIKEPKPPRVYRKTPEPIWELPVDIIDRMVPILEELSPLKATGRPRTDYRIILNGILFQARTGIQWKGIRGMGCSYQTMHRWLIRYQRSGVFQRLLETLVREAESLDLVNWQYMAI
ncbi:MAG: transposase, partial [Proteobacteria bacterium]|nr:transposase [Pseudomonadota bacterium]